jgi:hypothetical protein
VWRALHSAITQLLAEHWISHVTRRTRRRTTTSPQGTVRIVVPLQHADTPQAFDVSQLPDSR